MPGRFVTPDLECKDVTCLTVFTVTPVGQLLMDASVARQMMLLTKTGVTVETVKQVTSLGPNLFV